MIHLCLDTLEVEILPGILFSEVQKSSIPWLFIFGDSKKR